MSTTQECISRPCRGVVYLWTLDTTPLQNKTEYLQTGANRKCIRWWCVTVTAIFSIADWCAVCGHATLHKHTHTRAHMHKHTYTPGAETATKSKGANSTIARCQRQCIEVCSGDQSAQSAENFFAFIFQVSGWALVAPSCFVLQVRDVSPQETL